MSFEIAALAELKHQQTSHDKSDWRKVLESAKLSLKPSLIDPSALEEIALASLSPEKFTLMTRLIYQYTKSHPNGDQISDLIFGCVDNSPFSLPDWIDAIDHFHQWLVSNKRKIDFLPMLKYLECCVASGDAQETGQSLTTLVEQMLSVFDYEAG